jgi:hypothetical protein
MWISLIAITHPNIYIFCTIKMPSRNIFIYQGTNVHICLDLGAFNLAKKKKNEIIGFFRRSFLEEVFEENFEIYEKSKNEKETIKCFERSF